ncbi:ribokinase [Cereibacter sp. SYSU M97828]|nr:ribokinase [Cereibacter flavus]
MNCIVLGSINVDISLKTASLPSPGQTITAESGGLMVGGKGLNQAVAAHRMGLNTRFVGSVGSDALGEMALSSIKRLGLSTDGISIAEQHLTGIAAIVLDANSQNTIVLLRGANYAMREVDVDRWLPDIVRSKVMMLQMEVDHAVNLRAARQARQNGVFVCYDPAPVGNKADVNELLQLSDIVTPNESEALELTRIDPTNLDNAHAAASALKERGARAVVIKLGSRGAYLLSDTQRMHIPPFEVPTVDTVAAGDCFNAGLSAAIVQGRPLDQCVRYGAAAGALATTKFGGSESAPTADDIDRLLGSRLR